MRRVYTPVDSSVPVLIIEIYMMVFSLPQLPALLTEAEQLGPLPKLFLRELCLRMLLPTSLLVELPSLSPPLLRRRGGLWRLLLVKGKELRKMALRW
jgi:hypothetical protein